MTISMVFFKIIVCNSPSKNGFSLWKVIKWQQQQQQQQKQQKQKQQQEKPLS